MEEPGVFFIGFHFNPEASMKNKFKSDVLVSRSPGGSLAIDIDKSQLPPQFEGKKLALSGPTMLPNGEMILIITLRAKRKGLAPMFAPNTRHSTQRDRLITRFSVKRNLSLMEAMPFGMTECELSANGSRMEITVPAPEFRTKAIYKNEYRALDPTRRGFVSPSAQEAQNRADEISDNPQQLLFAAVDQVNALRGDARLFISDTTGNLGVELVTRYGG